MLLFVRIVRLQCSLDFAAHVDKHSRSHIYSKDSRQRRSIDTIFSGQLLNFGQIQPGRKQKKNGGIFQATNYCVLHLHGAVLPASPTLSDLGIP